jgi:hypothetical protein
MSSAKMIEFGLSQSRVGRLPALRLEMAGGRWLVVENGRYLTIIFRYDAHRQNYNVCDKWKRDGNAMKQEAEPRSRC